MERFGIGHGNGTRSQNDGHYAESFVSGRIGVISSQKHLDMFNTCPDQNGIAKPSTEDACAKVSQHWHGSRPSTSIMLYS